MINTSVLTGVVIMLMLYVGFRYSYLTVCRRIQPVFTSWLMFCISSGLSLWTYLASGGNKTWQTNVVNTVDCLIVVIVLGAIVWVQKIEVRFTRLQQICLVLTVGSVIYWAVCRDPVHANMTLQGIMVLGYLPILQALYHADKNTEPVDAWVAVWCATSIAIFLAIAAGDGLAGLYAGRAWLSNTIVLVLMARIALRGQIVWPPI